jgi:hypothetical protein
MNDSFELIYNDLNLEKNEFRDENQLLEIIADRVSWFLENDKNLLLSYMYRLDIDDYKIDKALTPINDDAANVALAKLILERQKQRLATKLQYKVEPIKDWEF